MATLALPPIPMPPPGVTKVNLYLKCLHLPDMDITSKTDARITVTLTDTRGRRVIGQTEVVKDTLNPVFATAIKFDYYFEEVQTLYFDIVDVDAKSLDAIGSVTCQVGDIFGARGLELVRRIDLQTTHHGKHPLLIIRAEEVSGQNANVRMSLSATHVDKKDFGLFAKSDPYLMFHKVNADGSLVLVHRTEVIKQTLDPRWAPFTIHISTLCNGDLTLPLEIQCWDWDKHGGHDFIGSCRVTLEQLTKTSHVDLINPEKAKKKKNYHNSGVLNIDKIDIIPEYSFLDYLAGGCQLNMLLGIDYTLSNGHPTNPQSLHYYDPSGRVLNQYAQAIINVGNVLLPYDSDGNIPIYGFGGRMPNGQTSHCFALTGDPTHPEVKGIEGALAVYRKSFEWVQLHGPTNMAPLIKQAATIASQYRQMQQDLATYLLLLIITDGEITDMPDTVDAIIDASALPLSIVIVGVGTADFSKMDALDSDDRLLSNGLKMAKRDIVQFVPFNKYNNPAQLASETLAELPTQFVEYMKLYNIKPNPRLSAHTSVMITQMEQAAIMQQAAPSMPAPSA